MSDDVELQFCHQLLFRLRLLSCVSSLLCVSITDVIMKKKLKIATENDISSAYTTQRLHEPRSAVPYVQVRMFACVHEAHPQINGCVARLTTDQWI